jgi:hypothetical protein
MTLWACIRYLDDGGVSTETAGSAVLAPRFSFVPLLEPIGGPVADVAHGISQWWLPFATGALFFLFLPHGLFCWLAKQDAPPTTGRCGALHRTKANDRRRTEAFLKPSAGLVLLITCYVILTIVRDYRSNFAANIWMELEWGTIRPSLPKPNCRLPLCLLFLVGLLIFVARIFRPC